jgi:2-methylcitrate dehydratase PrpD
MNVAATGPAHAERLADWMAATPTASFPPETVSVAGKLVLDVAGLCVAARGQDYVQATVQALDPGGACTAFGHRGGWSGFDAALLNGTAAHGEDYDDTFEGGPVHSGAVLVPALLAACERESLGGEALLRGLVLGAELLCRLSLVPPKAIHKAGFHPTAVIGAIAAGAAVATTLGLPRDQVVHAIAIAGSMASGIIEYLADGSWTKRMHAGWAAQSGLRAALMARGGFIGPRTVLEGTHGFYKAFAPSAVPDYARLFDGLGQDWVMPTIAFKPYACGTMTQPYIDCGIRLRQMGVAADDIVDIVCDVGEGTVHRLWEPLSLKHTPPTPYAAKFSTPFCLAVGFLDGRAGFGQFTEERIRDPEVLALCGKVRYRIDPDNEYPRNFTGHLLATLRDGTVRELGQPHMRGGARDPLPTAELEAKFRDNCAFGGWDPSTAARLRDTLATLFQQPSLASLSEFRI